MAGTDDQHCAVLTVAIADYDGPRIPVTPVHDAGVAFADLFEGPDGRPQHIALNHRLGPRVAEAEVRAGIRAWGGAGADIGLLLWTGHCDRDSEGQALVQVSDATLAATTLAGWIKDQRFRRWLVVVDGCFAGAVLDALYPLLDRAAAGPDQSCLLLGSSNDLDSADAGRFTTALAGVLADGPARGWWSTSDRFLVVGKVIDRLDEELVGIDPALVGVRPKLGGRRWSSRVFPNPLYRPLSSVVALDEAHFLPKARGIDTGESGWYFTGRSHVLRRIVAWLSEPGHGLFVVTGPAGTGKSAVLGRVVTLSVPEHRRLAEAAGVLERAPAGTVPPEGVVTAAFHARDKRLDQLLGFLGQVLDLGPVDRVGQLTDALEVRRAPAVLVVDALDEAATGHARRMVLEVLAPLARMAGVKVLVGTRPGVVRWHDEDRLATAAPQVADLAVEPDTEADIAAYATERLLRLEGSPYAGQPAMATTVGEGVAARALADADAQGRRVASFLVARVLTRTLVHQPPLALEPGWQGRLPSGFDEAFEADLATYAGRLGAERAQIIRDLLEALAWDEGSGLPRHLIPLLTEAVTGRDCDDDDVAMVLAEAPGHLSEAEVQGWAVYRLYHQRLREHLRAVTVRRQGGDDPGPGVHARITDRLIAYGVARHWADVDPYLAATLPGHARLGGRIEALVMAEGYLEHAEPDALLAAMSLTAPGTAGSRMRTYRRASHTLAGRLPDERRLALGLAAARANEEPIGGPPGSMSARWARGPLETALQTLTGHTGPVTAVAVGEVEGRAVAVTGGVDGTVRVWDLASGRPRGEPLTGHTGPVSAVAVGEVDGRAVAVTGSDDGTVRVWDLASGRPRASPSPATPAR